MKNNKDIKYINFKKMEIENAQFNMGKHLCLICNREINDNKLKKTQNHIYETIFCDNCGKYIKILCVHCKKKIYYKKINNDLPLNGMNGINIKCPYLSCNQFFFLTICPKCKREQAIPKIIREGELIKCIEIKDCGYEYLQIRCPIKDCNDLTYFSKPKNFCNSPNGIIYNHKNKKMFQKITCHFCIGPIVYISDQKKLNRYYDSMKILCPYKDCNKKFNRIICPICSEINIIENGYYFMGHKIKCNGCNNFFGKILCPKCKKINPLLKCFFKSGEIVCRYASCSKKSFIVNCIHCQRMNVFNIEHPPIPGQQIVCAYKDCGKIFNDVYCPSCNELNPFPKGDFIFGKSYQCPYSFCNKIFQYFVCPNCDNYSKNLEQQEGKKYICNKCKISLSNWGCPFCKKTIMDKNSSLKYGQIVKCPSCNKKYSFCRCYECQKLIFTEDRSILGLFVNCKNCKKSSVNIVCPNCSIKISFFDRIDNMEDGEKIKCTNCQKEFIYKEQNESIDENEIYHKNLKVLGNIKGEPIDFGESQVDENYLSVENLLIHNSLYEDNNNIENNNNNNIKTIKKCNIMKNNSLCIICHCNFKESVFYPCGHRCTCYKCAVYYYEVFNKCPRCFKNAEAIIPKIYELFNEKDSNENFDNK